MQPVPPTNRLPQWALAYAAIIRQWDALGFTPATSSNFSGRGHGAGFWVSRSGVDKRRFSGPDFIPVYVDGHCTTGDTPSAETLLHAVIYRHLPNTQFVAHTHSPKLTVLSRLWREHRQLDNWTLTGFELQKAFEGQTTHFNALHVPIWPNSQAMTDIASKLTPWITQWQPNNDAPGFLIAGHGLYTWASSLPALQRHVTTFESLATCTLDCWHYGVDLSTPLTPAY
jgi:methylthioribulose-1-phosphate dehydratase